MASQLHPVKIAPKGMGLNDFVAMQEGYFAAEGLDVEFDWKTFRGTQSSWKHLEYFQRPQDRPYTEDKAQVIQGACVWGSICNAWPAWGASSPTPMACRRGRSSCARIRASRRRKTSKTFRSRSACAPAVTLTCPIVSKNICRSNNIKTVNTGGFGARLKALLDGEVEAASLLPPQIAMAEQLGLRKIIADTFHTLWWVPEGSPPES